jgi:hypothetical protein
MQTSLVAESFYLNVDDKPENGHDKDEKKRPELKEWVRVEHLLWVLDPENLRHVAPPTSVRHRLEDPSFGQQVELASFYKAQIDLFAEMVLDRSCNTIQAFSEMLPYQLLMSCMSNDKIPALVRSSYTRLLCRLWIDRFPHELVKVPKRLQVLQQIEDKKMLDDEHKPVTRATHTGEALSMALLPHFELKEKEDPYVQKLISSDANGGFYKYRTAAKFHLIKEFISDYFSDTGGVQVYAEKEKNNFTLELLNCLHCLINYGFYDTQEEIKALIDPMVSTLDGRHDLEKAAAHYGVVDEAAEIGPLDASDIIELDDAREEVAKLRESLKKKIEESQYGGHDHPQHSRKLSTEWSKQFHFGGKNKRSGKQTEDLITHDYQEREELRKIQLAATESANVRYPRRYQLTNESVLVMQGKNAMLDNLTSVHKLQQDYVLSKFMFCFKRSKMEVPPAKHSSMRAEMQRHRKEKTPTKTLIGTPTKKATAVMTQLAKVVPIAGTPERKKSEAPEILPIEPVLTDITKGKLRLHPDFVTKLRTTGPGGPSQTTGIFQDEDQQLLDLDHLSTAKLDALLLDLLMYESEQLFEGAMNLLLCRFTERKLLLKNMLNSMLLTTSQLNGVPTVLELSKLRDHIESYEMWCVANEFSGFDDSIYKEVEVTLQALQRCMSSSSK